MGTCWEPQSFNSPSTFGCALLKLLQAATITPRSQKNAWETSWVRQVAFLPIPHVPHCSLALCINTRPCLHRIIIIFLPSNSLSDLTVWTHIKSLRNITWVPKYQHALLKSQPYNLHLIDSHSQRLSNNIHCIGLA